MFTRSTLLTLLAASSAVQAHMHLYWPPTLKGPNNPFTQGEADPYLDYPYGCCGKAPPGPCKGHLDLLDTSEGQSVVTWQAGASVNFTLAGTPPLGGNHYGGSCQVGFSTDKGQTFKVATSWEGDCPHRNNGIGPEGQSFDFNVPADLPNGDVIFAWTWNNREQEFFMNCAAVTISGGDGGNSTTPTSSYVAQPTGAAAVVAQPTSSSYTLEGCDCTCPSATGGECKCQCTGGNAARGILERKANHRHAQHVRRHVRQVQREEAVTLATQPEMLFSDYEGVDCKTPHTTAELKYPDGGVKIVSGDGEYPLELPTGSQCGL